MIREDHSHRPGVVLVGPARFREFCPDACRMLESAGHELILNPGVAPLTAAEITEHLPRVDAAIVGMETWDANLIASAPRLKILSKLGVGIDNIDTTAARTQGVDVTNAPGANANAVAECAIGLMLATARQIVAQDRTMRQGGWDRYTGTEIAGKTVSLLGFGQTSQHVARRLRGFDPSLLAYDPQPNYERAATLGVQLVGLDEAMSRADIVSVHIPHLPETHHMISDEAFELMRPASILVNTSRGGVVDEVALHRALLRGRPRAAGIDVWEVEPVSRDHPLLSLPQVVATCHGAADTFEAYVEVGRVTAEAIATRLAGGAPPNIRN